MNILEGKQSIQDIQRQFTALLYWPNCNFKTLSLDLCILFKVVLWFFFRGNDCLMTRKWVTINQLSSFIEPSSIWIAIKVSVTGNTARRNRPKLILFCFSVAALPVAKNEKDFVYLFFFFNLHWSLCGWYKWQPNNFCQTSSSTAVPNSTRQDRLSIWTHYFSSQRYENRFIPPVDLSSWVESWGYYFVNIVYSLFFMEATCFSLSTGCLVQTADTCW